MPPLHELGFQYQPISGLQEHEPYWAEALVRWNLPDGTVRGPLDILPHWLSEHRQDLFTRFSIERVAAALAVHKAAHVSVNLSPAQVTHPQTLASLEGLLPEVRRRMRVELTEQSYQDSRRLWNSLAALRQRCGALLLDDVTEHDADDRIPAADLVDGVKVDRSVTQGLADPSRRRGIERFVRSLSARFQVVVMEGVEDPAICDGLHELGATHVQGFGVGQPRPELVQGLHEQRLPEVEAAAARAVRLRHGKLMLGDGDSELHL
jgi:EAL domain-containing protein (putative c-di-GMP-specific phosphodiesterase class I)